MDRRVGIGVGLFLALEVMNTYQLVLPPLYGNDDLDSRDIKRAAKFVAGEALVIAFLAGALTRSGYAIVIPSIAIGAVYLAYMYETGKRLEPTTTGE